MIEYDSENFTSQYLDKLVWHLIFNYELDNTKNFNYSDSKNQVYCLSHNKFKEALASESMVGSIAHSVVLVRVDDASKTATVAQTIKDNVNPRKWLCVGVEEDQVIVKNKGNLIILIMVADGAEELEAGFDSLK